MEKKLLLPFGIILFFFLCLFAYTRVAPFPLLINSVQTNKTDMFQVSGTGKATAVPNTATISFGVTKQAATVPDAQTQTNNAISTILNGLKSQGIAEQDIKTTNYSVNPNYQEGQTISGYTVTQNIQVKVEPLDKVNTVLNIVTQQGANLVGQVSFGFDDKTQQKLEDEARSQAVQNAKEKAQSLASAAGIHLGNVINVVEAQMPPTPIPFVQTLRVGEAAAQPTQVTPGENTITSTITLSYQIY